MKIYLINLDKNPERLEFMSQQLAHLGLPFERVPAVSGSAMSEDELRSKFARYRSWVASKKRMSAPEVGVALSHGECYRRLLESGEKIALILEDDVVLSPEVREALARIDAFADPNRVQVVALSGYGVSAAQQNAPGIRAVSSFWCADAYCVTAAAARLLLILNRPVVSVADSFKRWHRRFGLELYRIFPIVAHQDDVTFPSENKVLPKSGWFLRNILWVVDWLWCKIEKQKLQIARRRSPDDGEGECTDIQMG